MTWNGYTFVGWFTAATGGTQLTSSTAVTITANQTLYAHWTPVTGGDIIYVNDDAPGTTHDGASWATAYTDLQSALAAATSGKQIWVAAGTYKPSVPAGRAATFRMIDGVAMYGGFAGYESSLSQRNWQANVTILSGDINGNDSDAIDLR